MVCITELVMVSTKVNRILEADNAKIRNRLSVKYNIAITPFSILKGKTQVKYRLYGNQDNIVKLLEDFRRLANIESEHYTMDIPVVTELTDFIHANMDASLEKTDTGVTIYGVQKEIERVKVVLESYKLSTFANLSPYLMNQHTNNIILSSLCFSDEKIDFKSYDYDYPITDHIVFILPYNSLDDNFLRAQTTLVSLQKMMNILNKYNKITADYVLACQDNQDVDYFEKSVVNNKLSNTLKFNKDFHMKFLSLNNGLKKFVKWFMYYYR